MRRTASYIGAVALGLVGCVSELPPESTALSTFPLATTSTLGGSTSSTAVPVVGVPYAAPVVRYTGRAEGFDPGPLAPRGGHSLVWTGDELIIWGGWGDEEGEVRFSDGAAFSPATGEWRLLNPSPLSPRKNHIAAWTGSEMLIIGGLGQVDAAAYDPTSDSWRRLADSPFLVGNEIRLTIASVWIGDVLLVWLVANDEVFAYSPESDRWDAAPAPDLEVDLGALITDGRDLFAFGVRSGLFPAPVPLIGRTFRDGAWSVVPGVRLSTQTHNIAAWPHLVAVTAGRVVAYSDSGGDGRTVLLAPGADEWIDIQQVPIPGCEWMSSPIPIEGGFLVPNLCGDDAIFNEGSVSWIRVALPDGASGQDAVWTGSEIVTWGDACCYGTPGVTPFETVSAWRFTPPPTVLPDLPRNNAEVRAIANGPAGFVAVGLDRGPRVDVSEDDRAAVWLTDDGSEWFRIEEDPTFLDASMRDVVWFPSASAFVAVGTDVSNGSVWISPDGVSWSQAALLEFANEAGGIELDSVHVIKDELFLFGVEWVGEGECFGVQWKSGDGVIWETVWSDRPCARG